MDYSKLPPPKNGQLSSGQERKSTQLWKSRRGILRSGQERKSGRISIRKVGRSWGGGSLLYIFIEIEDFQK